MNNYTDDFCQRITKIFEARLGSGVSLNAPIFDHSDEEAVQEVVNSGWVSYQGRTVDDFERALLDYLGSKHVIATMNGTAALFIALKASNISFNEEVIVPALSFVATANAVVHVSAMPNFVDVCEKTLSIDWDKLEEYLSRATYYRNDGLLVNKRTGRVIKAMLPVHVLGAPFNIGRAMQVAKKYNLILIEDSAEALGSKYDNRSVGAISGVGILSFNGNKIITTGGGGAVCLDDTEIANRIRHLATTAKCPHEYEFIHDDIGYNLRMPALNAALGLSQLKKLENFVQLKRKLYSTYQSVLKNVDYGQLFNPDSFGTSNCWLNGFVLRKECKKEKNFILQQLNSQKISVRPLWRPLNMLKMFQTFPHDDCSVAQSLYERAICLPSSPNLGIK